MINKKLNILFCPAHYVYDGVSRGSELSWAFNIADRVSSQGAKSVVVTGFAHVKESKSYKIVELQQHKKSIDLSLFNSLMFNFKYSWYGAFSFTQKFDVHHHLLPFMIGTTFNLLWAIGLKKTSKTVIGPLQMPIPEYQDNVHDFNEHQTSAASNFLSKTILAGFSSLLGFLSRRTLLSANKIVVIDRRTQQSLVDLGISLKKIAIIPPGIDTNIFVLRKKITRRKSFKLLTVSYLISRKKIDLILQAVALVVKKNKYVELEIVGIGPQQEHLQKLGEELGISEQLSFAGFVENSEIHRVYQRADAFITASAHESWGQMYLEAMSTGLPIITTANHGAKNIVESSFGLTVDSSPQALANAILVLMKDHDKMIQMGKHARVTAVNKYDWKTVIIPQYIDLYMSLNE